MNTNWNELRPILQGIMDDATRIGEECGCQLAIYHHGKLVLDLCSGFYSPDQARPITSDALFPVFSCGKGVMTTAMHCLVRRGLISYDTRIGDIWPAFDCNRKHDIQLWHFMNHTAGLQQLPVPGDSEELAAWDYMCTILAKSAPAWEPGTRCAYHGVTFAWLMGETAAIAARKNCRDVVLDEVLKPLGIENEFFFGTTSLADQRFVPVDASAKDGNDRCAAFINNPVLRHAVIPSANGVCSARALARHYAALIGEVDGVRLLNDALLSNATKPWPPTGEPPRSDWARFGLGYVLTGPDGNLGLRFGHGGACGSEGFADRESGVAVAFTKNKSLPTHPNHPIRDRISAALGLPVRHW
ncbi:MAG: beta-lactamase family protein [Victivallales bacterium]|nr:beta-lactamase family protein [Victivallales bacterium]